MLTEIKNFMVAYNDLDDPYRRVTLLRAFAVHVKQKSVALVSFILKLDLVLKKFVKEEQFKKQEEQQKMKELKRLEKNQKAIKSLPKLSQMKELFAEGDIFGSERKIDPANDLNKTMSAENYT